MLGTAFQTERVTFARRCFCYLFLFQFVTLVTSGVIPRTSNFPRIFLTLNDPVLIFLTRNGIKDIFSKSQFNNLVDQLGKRRVVMEINKCPYRNPYDKFCP